MPINHPAAVLYTPSRMELLKSDFLRIKKVIQVTEGKQTENELSVESSPDADRSVPSMENSVSYTHLDVYKRQR